MDTLMELAPYIAVASSIWALYWGLKSNKRADTSDTAKSVSQLTTILLKLEMMETKMIENNKYYELLSKNQRDDHDRIIKLESSYKSIHKRLDIHERVTSDEEE